MPMAPVDLLSSVCERNLSPSDSIWVVVTVQMTARVTLGTRASRIRERRMEARRRRRAVGVRRDIVVLERTGERGGVGTNAG
ncbi:hypothetical protein GCM10022207_04550 [Streptomyces lannensis]|uniref:Uncharacterized protein n=1 Tax=Streptomyces lannensis TaxID=766498 RepID=A0ABP7JJX2_9ACTN